MTFTTESTKRASFRASLVRVQASRDVTDLCTSLGGNVFSYTFPAPVVIKNVERNGTALTLVASFTDVNSNYEYYYDATTYELRCYSSTAMDASTAVFVVNHYLFFSDSPDFVLAPETPTDSSSSKRTWEPRLTQTVAVEQDVSNAISGVFSISATNVDIANADRELNQWLGPYDSFYNKGVDAYMVINATTARRVFHGVITGITINSDSLTLNVEDLFAKMGQTAYMGDTIEEAVFTLAEYPSLDLARVGYPCRFIVGDTSRYEHISGTWPASDAWPFSVPTAFKDQYAIVSAAVSGSRWSAAFQLDPSWEEATNIDYSPTAGDSTNLDWILCRVPSGSLKTQVLGTWVRGAAVSSNKLAVYWDGHNLRAGEVLVTSGGDAHFVTWVGDFVWTGTGLTYNVIIERVTGATEPNSGTVWNTCKSLAIIHQSAVAERLLYSKEHSTEGYTVTVTPTSGGNDLISISFPSGVGMAGSTSQHFDPDTDKLYFRVFLDADALTTHGEVVQALCESSGLTVNAASITAANAAFDGDCLFSIPARDEVAYGSYLDYCEMVLRGTFGVLSINSDQEVEYKLLAEPSATAERDEDSIIDASISADIDYGDAVSRLVCRNEHHKGPEAESDVAGPYQVRESLTARYLHGIDKTAELMHVMTTLGSRLDLIFRARSNRRLIYTYETATKDLEVDIGDDIRLVSEAKLGSDDQHPETDSVDLTVVGYSRSPDGVTIKATDLRGASE
jgi:hypothetical protein